MKHPPRPGVWGDDARPGEICINECGVAVYNRGALSTPLIGEEHRLRRTFRFA